MRLTGETLTITKNGAGRKISGIAYGDRKLDGYFIPHQDLMKGKRLVITVLPGGPGG